MPLSTLSAVFFSLSIFMSTAFAWGPTGHRTVGDIAQRKLNAKAKKCVDVLLDGGSLARASTWPDELRSEPAFDHVKPWHYTVVRPGKSIASETPVPEGDILTALEAQEKILRDGNAALAQRRFALELITHFMGDLHQPLHIGDGTDRGGNACEVRFFGEKTTNLHWVWDDGLIGRLELSYTELSDFLRTSKWRHEEKAWSEGNYRAWIDETAGIRDSVYPKIKEPGTRGAHAYCRNVNDPKDQIPESIERPNLEWVYQHEMNPTLERQLLKGGWRLAATLNRIFKASVCTKSKAAEKKKGP